MRDTNEEPLPGRLVSMTIFEHRQVVWAVDEFGQLWSASMHLLEGAYLPPNVTMWSRRTTPLDERVPATELRSVVMQTLQDEVARLSKQLHELTSKAER